MDAKRKAEILAFVRQRIEMHQSIADGWARLIDLLDLDDSVRRPPVGLEAEPPSG
jgi:hypothetical protein